MAGGGIEDEDREVTSIECVLSIRLFYLSARIFHPLVSSDQIIRFGVPQFKNCHHVMRTIALQAILVDFIHYCNGCQKCSRIGVDREMMGISSGLGDRKRYASREIETGDESRPADCSPQCGVQIVPYRDARVGEIVLSAPGRSPMVFVGHEVLRGRRRATEETPVATDRMTHVETFLSRTFIRRARGPWSRTHLERGQRLPRSPP